MKQRIKKILGSLLLLGALATSRAGTTIDAANHFAYAANAGWTDWRGDTTNGVVLGEYVCSGYIYSANVGWIKLGSGSPANGIRYQNVSGADFGVNHDGFGNLSGYAYGANIGWVNFETNGAPKINLQTGDLSGYIYSANCGWISLSTAVAHIQTDTLSPGRLDTNGLPISWELSNFGTTNINPNADPDHDGMSNLQEYLAGTDPNDANSNLRILSIGVAFAPEDQIPFFPDGGVIFGDAIVWTSTLSRNYRLQESLALNSKVWFDSGLGLIAPDGATTTGVITDTNEPMLYFRVSASLPLSP